MKSYNTKLNYRHSQRWIFCVILSFCFTFCLAKTGDPHGPKLYYFLIDQTLLLRDHRDNAAMLDALDALLDDVSIFVNIDSILVTGAASPIGSRAHNDRLSRERAEAVKTYIMWKHPATCRSCISTAAVGIDWEGFHALVATDPNIPSRDKLLELFALDLPENILLERLRLVGGRETLDYLVKNIYPKQQYAAVRVRLKDGSFIPPDGSSPLKQFVEKMAVDTVNVVVEKTVPVIVRDTVVSIIRDTVWMPCAEEKIPVIVDEKEKKNDKKRYYFGVKSNLFYDAALLPNLSIEFPFGDGGKWSAVLEGNWSWWIFGHPVQKWQYHRIQAAGIELRKWFSSPFPLSGHALGVYAFGGTYDIRFNAKDETTTGWLSNCSWSAGLSYGYSFALNRHFSMELGIAAGYLTGTYYDYDRCMKHQLWAWKAEKKLKYLGITRAGVSIVWIFPSCERLNGK